MPAKAPPVASRPQRHILARSGSNSTVGNAQRSGAESLHPPRPGDATALSPSPAESAEALASELFSSHAKRLYEQVLFPSLGNAAAAEDALSETFRAALPKLQSVRNSPKGLYPWLAAIARNKALDMHRARGAKRRALVSYTHLLAPLAAQPASPEQQLLERLDARALAGAVEATLERLNGRYRHALQLRFFDGLPRSECARILEVSVATFDVVLLRSLRAFRKHWSAVGSRAAVARSPTPSSTNAAEASDGE